MTQAWYLIEPQAPLVFRSGKPFEAGSRDGANFPWPSSLAGLMRTQVMDAKQLDPRNNDAHLQQLRACEAIGPFPLERDENGKTRAVWLPKPADAVLLHNEAKGQLEYVRLMPGQHAEGTGSDLPQGLLPVQFAKACKGKPQPGPAWWPLASLLEWMQGKPVDVNDIASRCERTPWQVATRTHVGIDRTSFASENGKLFQTEGLDFDPARTQGGWAKRQFALLARGPQGIAAGAVTFGGERRLSWLAPHHEAVFEQPEHWAAQLDKGFALTLATPALFAKGWIPAWLDNQRQGELPGIAGLRVRLRAAALDRWQGISGWDLAKQRPRAARKAIAAGATFWFEVLSASHDQLRSLWLASICDNEQDRRDGFGIVLPRPWNPESQGETS